MISIFAASFLFTAAPLPLPFDNGPGERETTAPAENPCCGAPGYGYDDALGGPGTVFGGGTTGTGTVSPGVDGSATEGR